MADPTDSDRAAGRHAIVVGASLAGLAAARALANHFDRVTIVDRDHLPEGSDFRAGVPQSRHIHVLLRHGQLAFDTLFPGLSSELTATGAPSVDWAADVRIYSFGGWKPRFHSGIVTNLSSRANLEWLVRRRLAGDPRIGFRDDCDVVDLTFDRVNCQVTGILVRPRGHAGGASAPVDELHADLVVDASGRDSHTPTWLPAHGYKLPEPLVVNSFLGYASRWYEPPPGFAADWKALLVAATPPMSSRGAVVCPVEGNRWMVTLAGAARDYPPTDEEGFLAFARTLPSPILYETLKESRPLSRIWGYRRTENRFPHYERAARWPESFVVLGDAACCFNPLYGQGMSVAASAALVLDQCLREQTQRASGDYPARFARDFQRRLARIQSPVWLLATGEDFRYPQTEGERPGPLAHLFHRYFDRVLIAATSSPPVHQRWLEILHLLKPPTALFGPFIVARVLASMARGESVKPSDLGQASHPLAPGESHATAS